MHKYMLITIKRDRKRLHEDGKNIPTEQENGALDPSAKHHNLKDLHSEFVYCK